MRKHLTALLAAAALTLSAAPLTALAKEEPPGSMLPDWVPRDYLAAVDFCNTYGKTHIHDGYVCIVRKAYLDETPQPDFNTRVYPRLFTVLTLMSRACSRVA